MLTDYLFYYSELNQTNKDSGSFKVRTHLSNQTYYDYEVLDDCGVDDNNDIMTNNYTRDGLMYLDCPDHEPVTGHNSNTDTTLSVSHPVTTPTLLLVLLQTPSLLLS